MQICWKEKLKKVWMPRQEQVADALTKEGGQILLMIIYIRGPEEERGVKTD